MDTKDPETREKRLEIVARIGNRGSTIGRYIKIWVWRTTIRFAYGIKRFIDLSFSIAVLILLFPLFIITTICIGLENQGPVFYAQTRVGMNGRHFRFYKFRSMVAEADKLKGELTESNESTDGVIFKMKKDPRITRVGRLIRKFSIDELPQLINVLKGEMSLVGPRPPLPREVSFYTLTQRKRLHIKPGITCIWQVSGRSEIPFTDQVRLDLQYIQSAGIMTDLWILLKTIPAVITGKGAY